MKSILLAACIVFVSVGVSSACTSDADCGPTGKCIKISNDIKGACIGPYGNTENKDRERYDSKTGGGSVTGKQCSSNFDCSNGETCIRYNNDDEYGTCSR
jgi:hypothetical protein